MRYAAALVLFIGCGQSPDIDVADVSHESELRETSFGTPALPDGARDVTTGDEVWLCGCTFRVGSANTAPLGVPPQYIAFIEKVATKSCRGGFVVIGSSAQPMTLGIGGQHGQVVGTYSFKATPSGSAHSQLGIVGVRSDSGEEYGRTFLAAMSPGPTQPQLGNVFSGDPVLWRDTLVVTGSKNGVIPGETGTGERYRATFRHFALFSVVAY